MGKYVARKGLRGRGKARILRDVHVRYVPGKGFEEKCTAGKGEPTHSPIELGCSASGNVHVRPSVSISALVGSRQNTLPYQLRARSTSGSANMANLVNDTPFPVISGYRAVSLHLMENSLNEFLSAHRQMSPSCVPQIRFMSEREQIRGMCVSEVITCRTCRYTSAPNQLYSEVATDGQKGRKAGDLNIRLAIGMQNVGIGVREVRELFAVLDLPVPCASALQALCNKTSDMLVTLGKQVMSENCQKVKTVLNMWNDQKLIVESDTSYNNAIKGRSFYQPGTQAFCPLIEQVTSKKLIIAHNIKNKLCRRCQMYGKNHPGACTANYPKLDPIGNAELALAKDNMNDLLSDASGLIPTTVVTDNDGKIVQGMNNALKAKYPHKAIAKEDCEIHVSRGQRRRCIIQPWSEEFAGKKNTSARQGFIQDLANVVVKRCACELKAIKLHATGKDFNVTVQQAKDVIIPCFRGDHGNCKMSYVCPAHFKRKTHAKHLPGKRYLRGMTASDVKHLQSVVDYKLGSTMVTRQHNVTNTNKSEAIHNKIFRAVPKNKTFCRNVNGRSSTQIIGASLGRNAGIKRSCVTSLTPLSKQGPGQKVLKELHKRDVYVQTWRTKPETKQNRKKCDYNRKNKSRARNSLYSSNHLHPTMTLEHDYAQNLS